MKKERVLMRKRRILLLALLLALMGCMLTLFSCKGEECVHTFSSEWTSDGTHHWHAATCEHTDQKSGVASHEWGEGEVTTLPTETAAGERTYTCAVCGKTKTEAIEALGHQHTFADTLSHDAGGHYYAATCGHDVKKDYTAHSTSPTVTEPTCTEAGYTTHTCACGYSYQDTPISALDHNFVIASSNGDGTHNLVCANDASHTSGEECSYQANVVTPACTTGGYTTHTCPCGDSYTDEEHDPNGHQFAEVWSSNDAYHWYAALCEHNDQMDQYAPHNYNIFVSITAPTCTEDGYTTYACVCGKQEKRDIVTTDGHDYGEPIEVSRTLFDESCCKYAVIYTTSCAVCGDPQQTTQYTEVHVFYYEKEKGDACTVTGDFAVRKPTCKTEGIQHKHCSSPACQYYSTYAELVFYEDHDAHVWDDGVENGNVITYTCTEEQCDKTKNTAVVSGNTADISGGQVDEVAIGETTINMNQTMKETLTKGEGEVTITAGVTEDEDAKKAILEGYGFTLDDIGSKPIYSFTVSGADEEDFGEGGKATITIPYTLEGDDDRYNIIVFYISNGKLIAIEADYWEDAEGKGFATFKTEHFSDYVPTSVRAEELCELFGEHSADLHVVAPTCTTGGHTVCLRCNKVIATTEALGHTWLSTVVEKNTCSTNGKMNHTCALCDTAYDTVIAATGHYYVQESVTAASCQSEGRTVHGCIYCEDTYTETKPQLAHRYTVKTVAPTCTERGYTQKSCVVCGDVQTSYTAPLGHDLGTAWESAEEGHYHTCLTCGARGEVISHVAGAEATEEHAQLCTVCEYVLVPQLTHQHKNMTHFEGHAASCTESGNKAYYVCACGKWFLDASATQLITDHTTVILDATGHTNEVIPYTAPGCETPGNTAGVKCAVCDKLLRGNIEIAPTGHDYRQEITKPTCVAGGYTVFTCACGDTYRGNETAPLGHRYTSEITLPDCTNGGFTTYTCLYCEEGSEGHTFVDDMIPALGHAFSASFVSDSENHWHVCARCEAKDGFGVHVKDHESATEQHGVNCEICGYEIEKIKDHAHAPARVVAAEVAGCTTAGKITHYICLCGEWFFDEACTQQIRDRTAVIVPATGHSLNYHEQINATCYAAGTTAGYSCTNCSYTGGRVVIPMTDHNFNTPVRYDKDGHWHKCLTCNVTDEKQAHTYDERVTEPTCTAPGYTEFSCACGYEYVGAHTAAAGHKFGEPAANYDGTHTRVCAVDPRHRETVDCEYVDTVVEATCNERGYTLHTCECSYNYKDTYVGVKGHAFGAWTPNGDGTHTRVCANDAGHTEKKDCTYQTEVTAPTCTEQGYTTYTCECGHSYKDNYTAALNHAFGKWTPNGDGTHTRVCANDAGHTEKKDCTYQTEVSAPTCTEQGYTTYMCECGHSYKDNYTAALNHAFGKWTPNGDGTHTRVCANNAGHTETKNCVYVGGVCGDCGYKNGTDAHGRNVLALEKVYNEESKCYYLSVTLKGADLAGILFRVNAPFAFAEAQCLDGATYRIDGGNVYYVFSSGENYTPDLIRILALLPNDAEKDFDLLDCTLEVIEIYRFAENGSLVVPDFTVTYVQ